MDVTNPEWIAVVRDNMDGLVTRFGIDAIHLDAALIDTPEKWPLYEALREAMPHVLWGCEYMAEMNCRFYHLCQNGSLPPPSRHPLTDLTRRISGRYLKFYYHLCVADAFVPVGTVCDHRPVPDEVPQWRRELADRKWREGPAWGILPNIRMNYRDYGLDPRTMEALVEVLGKR
jgi:hypothetical protein